MKKTIITIICFSFISGLIAQNDTLKSLKNKINSKIKVEFSLNSDHWFKTGNSIKTKTISLGMEVFASKKIYFGKSPLGVSVGLGITTSNYHYNQLIKYDSLGRNSFSTVPTSVNSNNIKYKKDKLSLTYIEIPIEFFYRPKDGNDFNASLGVNGGYLMSSHTKYKGSNLDGTIGNEKVKTANIKNLELYRYGVIGRIGFSAISISATYWISNIFTTNKAVDASGQTLKQFIPITFGITYTI